MELIAARGSHLYEPTVLAVELRDAWVRISYAQRILRADHLTIEGDSTMVVIWIQDSM